MVQFPKHQKVLKITLKSTGTLLAFAILLPLLAILLPNIFLAALTAQTAPGTQDPRTQIPGWTLKFVEECDGAGLNYSKWSPHPPGKLILGGVQTWVPNAVEISGGQ